MTLFVGGPYHGRDLPVEPMAQMMRLPREEELDAFLGHAQSDPSVTGKHDWPYLYRLDQSTDQPYYRFVKGSE